MTRSLARPAAELYRHLTPVGLSLPPSLPLETWAKLGRVIGGTGRALQWAAGDWLLYGEDYYGEKHAQAIDATGLQLETLANYATVCRAFPRSRRRESVPFALHAELASLPPAEQDTWLNLVEAEEGWTRGKLREALGKGRKALEAGERAHPECPSCRCRKPGTEAP